MPINENIDNTIIQVLRELSGARTEISKELVTDQLGELLSTKTESYGDPTPILDLIAEYTNYGNSNIPGGEVQACYRLITKLIRYMNLRAVGNIQRNVKNNNEGVIDSSMDIVGEAVMLYKNLLSNIEE